MHRETILYTQFVDHANKRNEQDPHAMHSKAFVKAVDPI